MRRFWRKQEGFTLVELMAVVTIIGILTTIAVPVFNAATDLANRRVVEANLRMIDGVIQMHHASRQAAKPAINNLVGKYLTKWPEGPDGVTYRISDTKPYVAEAVKGATTGDWFPGDVGDAVSLPVNWED